MPSDYASDIADRIRLAVAGGYDTVEQIIEDLTELIEYDPDAAEYVSSLPVSVAAHISQLVESALDAHRLEEAAFPRNTDCDRLSVVFEQLRASGILAEEDVGTTMSDVRDDMWDALNEARGRGENVRGWVAFHRQDVDRVVDTGVLYLAFAADVDNDDAFRAVGAAVADACAAAGFRVNWDGDPDRRIELVGLRWQRRRNPPH